MYKRFTIMAPWFETRTTHLFEGIRTKTTVKELRVGQRIKLERGGTSMDVEILNGDEAKVAVSHKHLAVQIWTPRENGTKSFEKDFIPFLAHCETVERKSIILENGNVTSTIEWKSKQVNPEKTDTSGETTPALNEME